MSILELDTKRPEIYFTVAATPIPKGSMRAFVRGGRPILTSDNVHLKDYALLVRYAAQQHVRHVDTGGMAVDLRFLLKRPKSLRKGYTPHTKKPDIDKLARSVLDALTGVAWVDDSQVLSLSCIKRYVLEHEQPGVTIRLRPCYATGDVASAYDAPSAPVPPSVPAPIAPPASSAQTSSGPPSPARDAASRATPAPARPTPPPTPAVSPRAVRAPAAAPATPES